jgi:hypothetical protein
MRRHNDAYAALLRPRAEAQCFHQHGEGRRWLTAARVIEMIARERRTPVCEHPNKFAAVEVLLHLLFREICQAKNTLMALRWTAAAMQEAAKGFRRLKACRQLPLLRAALAAHQSRHAGEIALEPEARAA